MKKRDAVAFVHEYYNDYPRWMQRVVMRAFLIGRCASHFFQGEDRVYYLWALEEFKHQKIKQIARYIPDNHFKIN